jgi:peroxiredoxin
MKGMSIYSILAAIVFLFSISQSAHAQDAKIVSAEDAAKSALTVGAKAPAFSLKDSTGTVVAIGELLKKGPLVLVFYRGSWCPFCNTYLHKLQTRLSDINSAGGKLVAVSVENPDASAAVAKKNSVEFTVLSDPNLDVARKFGIVYRLPAKTDEQYRSMGLDVAKHNSMPKPELPLAATYIIDKKGNIVYAFIETDYKKRAEPDVIVEQLKRLR